LEKNGKQIGGEGIENVLVNMLFNKKALKRYKDLRRHFFMLGNGLNKFQFGSVQVTTSELYRI